LSREAIGDRTWRRRENGRHAVKLELVSMLVMNDWQLAVMLLLNPISRGVGNWLVASGVAAAVVLEGATVVVAVVDTVDVELIELEEWSLRRLRSPCIACRRSGVQAGSTSSVPKLASSVADPEPKTSGPSSWASTICSSIYTVAEENERQHVRNIKSRRWVVCIGR
jgi:hypothetical protein